MHYFICSSSQSGVPTERQWSASKTISLHSVNKGEVSACLYCNVSQSRILPCNQSGIVSYLKIHKIFKLTKDWFYRHLMEIIKHLQNA